VVDVEPLFSNCRVQNVDSDFAIASGSITSITQEKAYRSVCSPGKGELNLMSKRGGWKCPFGTSSEPRTASAAALYLKEDETSKFCLRKYENSTNHNAHDWQYRMHR